MSATKSWSIGDVLTASDLNSNFTKLPYATSAFTASYSAGAILANGSATVAIAFPASRFTVAPICTFSTSSPVITPVLNAVTSGTVTVALVNNGASSSGASFTVYGLATQMTSGTAAG
jgi:hypothetical protein